MPEPADERNGLLLTLPNLITLARLAMVPAIIWLMLNDRLDLASLVFLAAGVSDALDGWLARVRNARSRIGAMLDPLADKALLISVFVTLAATGLLPDWLAILVVFREVVILGGLGMLWALGQRPAIKPLYISKVNTFAQIALAALALFVPGFGLPLGGLLVALTWIVAVTMAWSLLAYLTMAARGLRGAA